MEIEPEVPQKKPEVIPQKTNDIGMPFLMQMEIYYDKFFPYQTFIKWLSCSSKEDIKKNNLERREFSFTLEGDIYMRFLSFKDQEKFKSHLVSKKPIKIDVGAIYNVPPSQKNTFSTKEGFKAEEKEFIIDIDMNDYDMIRTCCKEATICPKCWKFLKLACVILEKALTDDFGFDNILWVFSGRRGIHCWVCDPQAKDLKNDARQAIVEYLSLVLGNKNASSQIKPNILRKNKHPSVKRALSILNEKFEEIVLRDQNVFDDKNQAIIDMVFNMIEFQDKEREDFERKWRTGRTSKDKWEILCQFIQEKNQKYKELKAKEKHKINNFKIFKRLKYLKDEILLVFLYPRLDAHVSTDIGHLLKTPFSVHPKTGKVCVPFKIANLNTFDPFSAPALKDLVADYNNDSSNESVYQRRMSEYYKSFNEFVRKLEVNCKIYQNSKLKKKAGSYFHPFTYSNLCLKVETGVNI